MEHKQINPLHKLEFRFGAFGATIPMLFFVIWAISISIAQVSSESALILGSVLGLAIGLLLCKSKWEDYAQGLYDGLSQPIGGVAILAWFWAGTFAQILQTGGLVEGLAWLGISLQVTGGLFVGITFILAAIFSSAVGTGYGTVVAFCTLLYPAGIALEADPLLLFAAILSGAAFGDNFAPVSDTTIVSAATQDTDIPGVVRSRIKYCIIAAIPALLLFILLGNSNTAINTGNFSYQEVKPDGLILLIPFALIIFLAIKGHHLLTTLTWGIITAIVIMLISGLASFGDFIYVEDGVITGPILNGIIGYVNMAILILLILAASHLLVLGGTMEALKRLFLRMINGVVKRAELTIWGIVSFLNVFITINTAAEIAAGPFVKEIGKEYNIHAYRRANMLDSISSALGYIFPWSAGLLLGWSTINSLQESTYSWLPTIEPTAVFPYVFHGWFLVIVMLIAAITGWGLRYSGKNGEEIKPTEYHKKTD